MPMTLAEARLRTREDFLDDPTSRRWSDAQLDRALKASLAKCVADYAGGGGGRFTRALVGVQSTVGAFGSGGVDLSSYDPLMVFGVMLRTGERRDPLTEVDLIDVGEMDDQVRDLDILLVPTPTLGAAGSDPLVVSTGVAGTWDAFDEWVCARAALDAVRKDKELHGSMQRLEADAQRAVALTPHGNMSPAFPRRSSRFGAVAWALLGGSRLVLVRSYGDGF
jgi:hypothetical protein